MLEEENKRKILELYNENKELKIKLKDLEKNNNDILNSTSWRLTKPIRGFSIFLNKVKSFDKNKFIYDSRVKYYNKNTIKNAYNRKLKYGLNTKNNRGGGRLIISLTSYPERFSTLHLCIRTLLTQSYKPDKVILYLDNIEKDSITKEIIELKKYGLEIKIRKENIKAHKKYFYAMQEYPNDIIITVDDDSLYDKDLVKSLMISYKKYPNSISCRRAHKIIFNNNNFNSIRSYNDWEHEYKNILKPSMSLLATGVGGVLYPPHCMNNDLFNINYIKNLSLNNDDIWLKFMQLLNNTPVVFINHPIVHPITIDHTQETALYHQNVYKDQNDEIIQNLIRFYNLGNKKIKIYK